MRTEIRGYLFSIRMFQVGQASDEGNRGTNKRRGRRGGGRGSVAVSLLHVTVSMPKASLVLERISKCILCQERRTHAQQEEINHVQDRYILKHQCGRHGGLILISYFEVKFRSPPNAERTKLVSTLRHVCNQWPHS